MMNKKKLGAFMLAGTMILGMGTTAFAAEIPNVNNGEGKVVITKDFEMAEGLAVPNYTFNFTVEKVTEDAPNASIETVTFSEENKGTVKDGKYVVSQNAAMTFGEWKHAGEYEYKVKETKGSDKGVTYSEAEYTVRVYVVNKDKGLEIEKITAQGKDGKTDKILFTNTYKKNDASLIIDKITKSNQKDGKDYADKTKQFDFTVKFVKSATEDTLENFTGTLTRKDGKAETVTCKDGTATFKLADGDKVEFKNLPVGTTYSVTEAGVKDDYTLSVSVVENGVKTVEKNGTDADDLTSLNGEKNNLVGEGKNQVTFTNTYKDIAITGIVMNNLPFILLIVVAAAAFGALAVVKKRRTSER